MAPGVTGLAPTGRVASSVALGTVVVPGAYTVPGVVPTGAAPPGVVMVPPGVAPLRVPLGMAPLVVPTCPGAAVPGAMGGVAPGATGTVWAEALVARPSPSRAAKANPMVFIRKFRISKKKGSLRRLGWLSEPLFTEAYLVRT